MRHRSVTRLALALALAALAAAPAAAQTVIPILNGSNGSAGALNVPNGQTVTVTLPPDGKLHYQRVTVGAGATLRFVKNSLNTPVFLLSQEPVEIFGTVILDGARPTATTGGVGGPGGFDGGAPAFGSIPPGPGHGPGGGGAGGGSGAHQTRAAAHANDGAVYGSALQVPLVGGSGGGGGAVGTGLGGGGGGGGAILVVSNERITITGTIRSHGALGTICNGGDNGGSGGTIRLVAPRVDGTGSLNVRGDEGCGGAGHGYLRVDTIDRVDFAMTATGGVPVSHGSFLVAFPDAPPRLDIVALGTHAIAGGAAVVVVLPPGSAPTQTLEVHAQDFTTGGARTFVRLEPDSGNATLLGPFTIGNATTLPIDVTLPVNVATRIVVWGEPQ